MHVSNAWVDAIATPNTQENQLEVPTLGERKTHNAWNITNSPPWRHRRNFHDGVMEGFQMNVTGTFRNNAMLRQITETVKIDNVEPARLLNTRAEWNTTSVPGMEIE